MKGRLSLPAGMVPLLVACLTASALHGLLLSFHQLKRARSSTPAPILQSRDNTPELLQFASQPAPLTSLESIPLPKASVLPPPPPADLLQPLAVQRGPASPAKKASTTAVKKPTGRIISRAKLPAQGRTSSPGLSSPVTGGPLADALQQLRVLQEREASPPSKGLQEAMAKQEGEGDAGLPAAVSAEQQEAFQELWKTARPPQGTSLKGLPEAEIAGVEIRQLPLRQDKKSIFEFRHQQVLRLKETLVLLWIDGETLWLLQTDRKQPSS